MEKLCDLTDSLRLAEATKNRELSRNVHNSLGAHYYSIGKYDKAIGHFELDLTISKEIGDTKGEGTAYGNLATCYISLGQYDKAIKYLGQQLNIAKENGDKTGKSVAYGNLGTCFNYLGQYDKAIKYLEVQLTIAKEIGDKKSEGIAFGNLGNCYRYLSQYDKAIKYLEVQLAIAKEIGHNEGVGAAYCKLGSCYLSLGQCHKAIMYLEMCIVIAKQIGDKKGEGTAHGNLGACYVFLAQFDKAIKYLEIQLTIAKEIGDKNGEEAAYGNLGVCYIHLSQYDKAINYLETRLTIAKEIGDKKGEGITHGNLGACYALLGQYGKAIKYTEIQLTTAKEIGDKHNVGAAHLNLGGYYAFLGKYSKAIKQFEICLSIAQTIGDKRGEVAANCGLASYYFHHGQYDKSIKYFEISLAIAKEIGYSESIGIANCNLGNIYRSIGQCDKAINYLEDSLTIAKEIGDKFGEGRVYGSLGTFYESLGQYDKAIMRYENSLSITKRIGDIQGEAIGYRSLGSCYKSLGQYDKALKYLENSLSIAKNIGDMKSEGIAYANLGICYVALGQFKKATKYLQIHLTMTLEMGDKAGERVAHANLGLFYNHTGHYNNAERSFRKAVSCCEDLFENAPMTDKDKVSVFDTYIYDYQQLISTLLVQEKADRALTFSEKGRSRALVNLIQNSDLVGYGHESGANVSNLHEIRQVVKALESTVLYFTLVGRFVCTWVIQPNGDIIFPNICSVVSKQSRKLYTEADLLPSRVVFNSLLNQVVKLMTSCSAVRCEDRSLSFLYREEESEPINKNSELLLASADLTFPQPEISWPEFRTHPSTMKETAEVTTTTARVDKDKPEVSLNHGQSDGPTLGRLLKALYQILLKPVRQHVSGSQVTVVPDGSIALVPFAALLDENDNYVSESLQVRLIPSLTTAKMIRERPERPERKGKPLIIGDPEVGEVVMDGKVTPVPKLAYARTEVEMVGQLLSADQLVGERATKARFLRRVENASLIHIAAHGHAKRGEILLSPRIGTHGRNIEDVMLTLTDLERKHIKAKLVVLSCCHSGRGKVRAEGVVGIARAFLGAGARAVVATLWAVDDGATLCFMYQFYKHLIAGESASEALNGSMKAIRELKNFSHPRYWAPFVLMGEDVTLFDKKVGK